MKTASTKIKETNLEDLYAHFYGDDLETFRSYCINLVQNARAPNRALLIQMQKMNKDQLVKSTTNFAFKGMGHGVI